MLNRSSTQTRIVTGPQPAVRLMFSYEGDQISLIDRQRVEKTLPPSDPVDEASKEASGFWFEVQNERGNALYRLVRANPIVTSVELPTGDFDRPFVRQDVEKPSGTFFVLVPELPEARDVVLFSSPIVPGDAERSLQAASELARVSLRDDPDRDPSQHGKERAS